tara:strand:- start:540 stop:1322 length:783 start_codon:yes stop_codon:yes gene_type:complete
LIPCYVINLLRRKDRLKKISAHLKDLKISFKRFDAIDGTKVSNKVLLKNMKVNGPLGVLSDGDRACFQSHYNLWKLLSISENGPVMVLEDDVVLSKNAPKILRKIDWIPNNSQIIKIDRFGNKKHKILISKKSYGLNSSYKLHYLLSKHGGTGGYIITPKGIETLLNIKDCVDISVDHYLFNPNNSKIFNLLKPLQLVPSICEQRDNVSDIQFSRLNSRKNKLQYYIQEIIRGYYEIRLLPYQIFQFLIKNAKLIKPRFF